MTSLFKMEVGSFHALVGVLDKAGLTAELAEEVRHNPAMAQRMVAALRVPEEGHSYRGGKKATHTAAAQYGSHGGDEYHVFVDYQMPRDKETLEVEFSKGGVSELFYGNYVWQLHSSCADIEQTPSDLEFLVKHFNRSITSDEAINEMDKLGYRPATHLDAYAFAKAQPELQRKFWIVALGSSTLRRGDRHVAVLAGDSDERLLYGRWLGLKWGATYRFLFVRKASS